MTGSCDLQVQSLECEIGDIFEVLTRSCSTCVAGSCTTDDPYKVNECPENFECTGGSKIGPKPSYCLYTLKALTAIKCSYSAACLY